MPSEGFEPTIPASVCPQTHAWDGAASGSAVVLYTGIKYFLILRKSKLHFFRSWVPTKIFDDCGKEVSEHTSYYIKVSTSVSSSHLILLRKQHKFAVCWGCVWYEIIYICHPSDVFSNRLFSEVKEQRKHQRWSCNKIYEGWNQ